MLISAVRAGGEPIAVLELSACARGSHALPGSEPVRISFVGLNFALGERLDYQYWLEGGGGQWSALTTRRTIRSRICGRADIGFSCAR